VILFPLSSFLPTVFLPLMPTTILFDNYLGCHASVRLLCFFSMLISALPPPLELAGRYSCLGVNSSRTLGSLRSQQLWPHVGIMIHYLYYIGREGMPIDLHRLFWRFELDLSCFDCRLILLAKHSTLASTMRNGVVPLAVLVIS